MRLPHSPILLCSGLPLLAGCHGAMWGNLLMLSVTVGIFLGTLSLGRKADGQNTATQSTSRQR